MDDELETPPSSEDGAENSASAADALSDVDALDYSDDYEDTEDEAEPEDDARAEEPEDEPAPVVRTAPKAAPSARPAPSVPTAGLTPEQEEELDELFLTNPREATNRQFAMLMQNHEAQQRVTNHYTRELDEQYPEFMAESRDDVTQMVQQYVRANPNNPAALKEGQTVGLLNAIFKQAQANDGDILKTLENAVAKMKGSKSNARPAPVPQKPALAPGQRTPAPGGSTAPVRQASRPAGNSTARRSGGDTQIMRELAREYGLDPATARNLEYDVK